MLRYSERVRYVEQLRRYHERFAPERILVLIYDDFRADNEATVRRVLRFLEVDDTVTIELLDANPTVRMRSVRLARLTHAVRTGRGPLGATLRTPIRVLTSAADARRGDADRASATPLWRFPAAGRGADARSAAALRAGGGGAERVPGPRLGYVVGL